MAYERSEDSYSIRADNTIDPALRACLAVSLSYNVQDSSKIPVGAQIGAGSDNYLIIASLAEVQLAQNDASLC
jgi:hypothetical protein